MSVDYCVQSLACTPDAKNHIDSIIRPAAIKPFDWVQGIQLSAFWQPWQQFQLALLSSTVAPKPTLLCELASVETLPINHRKRVLYSPEGGKKSKSRKLDQDTVTASPVSGMFIKEESALASPDKLQKEADELDETAAFVEVSEESRRQIGSIKNVIGECICKLCKVRYEDVFKLAQHRCPRIAHEEYNCPECDKSFSCPANLASHRRWHRPREAEPQSCPSCTAVLTNKRQLRAHLTVCQPTLEVLLGQLSPPCSFQPLATALFASLSEKY